MSWSLVSEPMRSAPVTHLDQGRISLPLAPPRPTQSSVPNRVQNIVTESMVQLMLSRPDRAHGLGETSTTMVNRDVQSESMLMPDPCLVHPGCPSLIWKHQFGIIRNLMFEYHPSRSCQFSSNGPNGDNAIGFGLFSFIERAETPMMRRCPTGHRVI